MCLSILLYLKAFNKDSKTLIPTAVCLSSIAESLGTRLLHNKEALAPHPAGGRGAEEKSSQVSMKHILKILFRP